MVAEIPTETADRTARWLARERGILVGLVGRGGDRRGDRHRCRREPDAQVVVIGCDTGARYLSEPHRWTDR